MRTSAALRPGMPNGLTTGPVKNETMPSLTAGGAYWARAATAPESTPAAIIAHAATAALQTA